MRICHVITKPELGGAQLSTLSILLGLPKEKYSISVITSPKGTLKPEFINLKNIKSYFSPFLTRRINPLLDILALIHIYLIYRRNRYGLIHTHSSKAGIIGRFAGLAGRVPIILHTVHGWPFNDYQNIITKRFFIFIERIAAKFTTKIICVSNKDMDTALRYKIAHRDKFIVIKYGIELSEFRKRAANVLQKRKELGINNNDPMVGMIACLKPQKSPLDYVRACLEVYKKFPNINFLLIGDGVLKKICKKELKAASLNGRFIFTGWRRDISGILDILDVVVLTSKWEGMPIAIIEALCKGKPIVVTDVSGARELVKDNISGYITMPGEYEKIAEKVLLLLKDKELCIKMGSQGAKSIDDSFDVKRMVGDIDELYSNLLYGIQ